MKLGLRSKYDCRWVLRQADVWLGIGRRVGRRSWAVTLSTSLPRCALTLRSDRGLGLLSPSPRPLGSAACQFATNSHVNEI